MKTTREVGRENLKRWQDIQPRNFFKSNHHLQRILKNLWACEISSGNQELLSSFGQVVVDVLDPAAVVNNRPGNLPILERWSEIGERTEGIDHHPSYHACGEAIYGKGRMIAVYGESPNNLLAQSLFYLSSHAGEAGHNCPVACTAGVVKALGGAGSEELKARWLPGLLTADYSKRLDGAQFLTEVQGGSDVGANCVWARPDGQEYGTTRWRIHGEKWFCSNADADLILITARWEGGPQGSAGLGLVAPFLR